MFIYGRELDNASKGPVLAPPIYAYNSHDIYADGMTNYQEYTYNQPSCLSFESDNICWDCRLGTNRDRISVVRKGQEAFSITSDVEWIIGVCGVASAAITAGAHMAGGDWN